MAYIIKRGKRYCYKRRVPNSLRAYDPREHVVIPLKTDSELIANQKSMAVNDHVERYWKELIDSSSTHSAKRFEHVVKLCALLNFTYKPSQELSEAPLSELTNRLSVVEELKSKRLHVEAVMGGVDLPTMCVSQTIEKYWEITKSEVMNKSPAQIRKWQNPRKKSIRNFIAICGDKELQGITRDDIIHFRDWWIHRIQVEELTANSANKDMIHLKSVITAVSEHMRLGLDAEWLFRKTNLKDAKKSTREPFENEFIQKHILNPNNHTDINDDMKFLLYALADTGARPSELVGLLPEDIILEDQIPHIKIRSRKNRQLKTPYSERDIPLVGCALWAFQKMPEGFPRYRDLSSGADTLSTTLNKHLRVMNLLPSENHTVYSLRHSFQDRLTDVGVPDRIQVQLMGHKFADRIEYGKGATLEKKQEWLLKICFEIPVS